MILEETKKVDFAYLKELTDLNIRWDVFKSVINKIIDKIAPLRKINERKNNSVPWYDSELYRMQVCVSKLYKIFKSNKSSDNHDAYKLKRNEYQKLLKVKRIEFYTKNNYKIFYLFEKILGILCIVDES